MSRAGISLLEVVLALLVMGLALLPVLELFAGARRHAQTTSDHSLAVALQEKVAEELRLEAWENVHLVERLLTDTSLTAPQPVVDGRSPFFAALEDVEQPFGRLQPGVDPAIDRSQRALYAQLEKFRVAAVGTARPLDTQGRVVDLDVRADWDTLKHGRVESVMRTTLGQFGARTDPPLDVADRVRADDKIREFFYPARTGQTLAAAAAAEGADLATLRDLGDLVVLMEGVVALEETYDTDVAKLRADATAATSPSDRAARQLALARRLESHLIAHLQAMAYLAKPLAQLSTTFTASKLGTSPPDPLNYRAHVLAAANYPWMFASTLYETLEEYARAYNDPVGAGLPPRVRVRAFMKLLELAKLQVVTSGPEDTVYLKGILKDVRGVHLGRNDNLARFAEAESELCSSAETLEALYPSPARAKAWDEYVAAITVAAPRLIAPPP